MQKKYNTLRAEYPEFIYESYEYELINSTLKISYNFTVPHLTRFHPTWQIEQINETRIDKGKLEQLIFTLGMVELISYWKAACSPKVKVECGTLNAQQITWWKKLYYNGLGEFFYINNITAVEEDFMQIESKSAKEYATTAEQEKTAKSVLIPVGGGKDSAVTLELLKENARYAYIINSRPATINTVRAANLENRTIEAKRTISPELLELNTQGFLNGHTPFSAVVAFSSLIAAYINGINYIALSNENSANQSTVADTKINHQYSKSYEFESDFQQYEQQNLKTNILYFSMLRPLNEIQIAKLFAKYPQYHEVFRSCNVGSKSDNWCGACPKCMFVYIILSPFLSTEELVKIFGKDMLNQAEMVTTFEKLVGIQPEKPFECVGSREEVNLAIQLTIPKYNGKSLPILLQHYQKQQLAAADMSLLTGIDSNNAVPPQFMTKLREAINA